MQKHSYACINYARQDKARQLIGKSNTLLRVYDAIVFTWQNSTFQHQGRKVSCPTLQRLAELTELSVRTIQRAIKKLVNIGLITSFIKRLFNGTVRLFFEVMIEKLDILITTDNSTKTPLNANQNTEYDILSPSNTTKCRIHIYKGKTIKEKNNINNNTAIPESNKPIDHQNAVDVNFSADAQVDVALSDRKSAKTANPEDTIGNTLTKRQHCRINGAINNLIRKEGVRISDPKGLKGQVAFKILLKSEKSGGRNFQHQLNAAMKLIRESQWSTPHGFYNHSDEGRAVKAVAVQQEKQWQGKKRRECQSGGLAALAAACTGLDGQVNADAENELVDLRLEPAMTSTDRVCIDGKHVLKSDAKARLDSVNESIGRYLERAKAMPDHLSDVLMGIVRRLRDEMQEITCALNQMQ